MLNVALYKEAWAGKNRQQSVGFEAKRVIFALSFLVTFSCLPTGRLTKKKSDKTIFYNLLL